MITGRGKCRRRSYLGPGGTQVRPARRYFFWTEGPAISRRDLNVGTAGPQREEFKVFLNNLFEKESAMRNKRLERE